MAWKVTFTPFSTTLKRRTSLYLHLPFRECKDYMEGGGWMWWCPLQLKKLIMLSFLNRLRGSLVSEEKTFAPLNNWNTALWSKMMLHVIQRNYFFYHKNSWICAFNIHLWLTAYKDKVCLLNTVQRPEEQQHTKRKVCCLFIFKAF